MVRNSLIRSRIIFVIVGNMESSIVNEMGSSMVYLVVSNIVN